MYLRIKLVKQFVYQDMSSFECNLQIYFEYRVLHIRYLQQKKKQQKNEKKETEHFFFVKKTYITDITTM